MASVGQERPNRPDGLRGSEARQGRFFVIRKCARGGDYMIGKGRAAEGFGDSEAF